MRLERDNPTNLSVRHTGAMSHVPTVVTMVAPADGGNGRMF
jgi:hypothetical protein